MSVSLHSRHVSIDWSKVDRIESTQLFMVKTQDGTVYTGRLSTPETVANAYAIEILEAPRIRLRSKEIGSLK